jgi:hypothetical protein
MSDVHNTADNAPTPAPIDIAQAIGDDVEDGAIVVRISHRGSLTDSRG